MNSRTLFAEAANFLEQREWGQGNVTYVRQGVRHYCMIGAIQTCAMGNPYLANSRSVSAVEELNHLICERERNDGLTCPGAEVWNDMDGRTKEEVIALLREADQDQQTQGRLNV